MGVWYRGHTMPEPYGRGDSWTINDGGFGYFTGSKDHVVYRWKRAVDEHVQRDALDRGDYEFSAQVGDWTCQKCGCRVADPWVHNNWHDE